MGVGILAVWWTGVLAVVSSFTAVPLSRGGGGSQEPHRGPYSRGASQMSWNQNHGAVVGQNGAHSSHYYQRSTTQSTEGLVQDMVSTELALLSANAAFYAAFRSGDFDKLCEQLHDDECISVIHPGIPPLYGRKAVLQSWRSVLAAPPQITPSEARVVQIAGDVAWLHCYESLEGTHGVRLAATNILKRDRYGMWRIVLHHAGSCM